MKFRRFVVILKGGTGKSLSRQPGNKSFLVYCFGNQGYRVFPVYYKRIPNYNVRNYKQPYRAR